MTHALTQKVSALPFVSLKKELTPGRVLHRAIICFSAFGFSWRIHPDNRQPAFTAFSQMTADDDKKTWEKRSG
jgi:hypothetical protein